MSDLSANGDRVKRPNALVRLYRGETAFDFVGRRRVWYALSGTIILAGLISFGVRGLNLGIDFKGGTSWQVQTPTLTVQQATSAVEKAGITPSSVQFLGVGSGRSIEVQADLSHLPASQQASIKNKVGEDLAAAAHTSVSKLTIDDVGATWGGSVTDKAIEAMIVFFVLVTIYISIRFQWRMAVAALMKVVLHDLVITVGIFALTNFQVTPDGVIAVLTIMGYSLYDTVVVFDKINENVRTMGSRRYNYPQIVNLSLNQVLARSLNTSLVAVLPVLSVLVIGGYILGAQTLDQFGFPLAIGLIAGAYSSIFIAAPLPGGVRAAQEALRKAAAGSAGGPAGEVLTPRGAAAMLAGSTPTARDAGGPAGGPSRVQPGIVRPGSAAARARQAPARPERDGAQLAHSGAPAPSPGSTSGAGADAPSAARTVGAPGQPGPRPRKGKGGKRRR